MDYTFTDASGKEQTVDIPMEYINKQMSCLGIGAMEACKLYLSDEGYIDNPEVEKMTEKANAGNPKSHKRKPDLKKRALINSLTTNFPNIIDVEDNEDTVLDIEIINAERVIQFKFMDDTYELTLSRKRKSKN